MVYIDRILSSGRVPLVFPVPEDSYNILNSIISIRNPLFNIYHKNSSCLSYAEQKMKTSIIVQFEMIVSLRHRWGITWHFRQNKWYFRSCHRLFSQKHKVPSVIFVDFPGLDDTDISSNDKCIKRILKDINNDEVDGLLFLIDNSLNNGMNESTVS